MNKQASSFLHIRKKKNRSFDVILYGLRAETVPKGSLRRRRRRRRSRRRRRLRRRRRRRRHRRRRRRQRNGIPYTWPANAECNGFGPFCVVVVVVVVVEPIESRAEPQPIESRPRAEPEPSQSRARAEGEPYRAHGSTNFCKILQRIIKINNTTSMRSLAGEQACKNIWNLAERVPGSGAGIFGGQAGLD